MAIENARAFPDLLFIVSGTALAAVTEATHRRLAPKPLSFGQTNIENALIVNVNDRRDRVLSAVEFFEAKKETTENER